MKALVIIPAYNEGNGIAGVLLGIEEQGCGCDVLVVNDGSADHTAEAAKKCGVKVVSHPFNMGYGVALQTGYKYAHRHGYDFVVQMDGDGQHDPKYIKNLLGVVVSGTADVVIGSRFLSGEKYIAPVGRRAGMFLFSQMVSLLIGQPISDSTSGFQAFNRKVVSFFTGEIYPADYPDADVIIMLHRAGFRIAEVPLVMRSKAGGKSMHSGLKPLYYIFKMTLSIFVTLLRKMPRVEEGG